MGLLTFVIILLLVALLIWVIQRWIPIQPIYKNVISWIIIALVVIWIVVDVFHIDRLLNSIKVGG